MAIHMTQSQAKAWGVSVATPAKRGPNKWEREYAAHLGVRQAAGEVVWWGWEVFKLRLADKTWYTPDFALTAGVGLHFVEVKGFMRDDAAVKLKVAAEQFPFPFWLAQKVQGRWVETLVKGRREAM